MSLFQYSNRSPIDYHLTLPLTHAALVEFDVNLRVLFEMLSIELKPNEAISSSGVMFRYSDHDSKSILIDEVPQQQG